MKTIALVLSLYFVSGCGWMSRKLAWWSDYAEVCAGGVLYYQFTSGAAPAYTLDGKLKSC